MFNAAIIGVSGFGDVHYRDLVREHAAGRVNIVAATVINQEEEAKKCDFLRSVGCRIYTDYRDMLRDFAGKIDVCFIPTGIALHMPMTVAALEAGANVYVEKPVAPTFADAEKMVEASKRTGRFVAVGYQTMYQPETRRIKECVLSGRLGKIRVLKSYGLWPRDDSYYHRNNWAGKLTVNGAPILDSPVTNAFAHFLNLLIFYAGDSFTGTAEARSIQAGLFRANPIESFDTASLKIATADGKELLFYVTHCSEANVNPVSAIEGDLGRIEYDEKTMRIILNSGETEEYPMTGWEQMRINIFNQLEKRLADPDAFICTAEIAMNHPRVTNAMFDSATIATGPADSFRVVADANGVERRVIPGIDDAIRRAYAENRMLNAADFPWAVPTPEFSLDGYRSFRGTLIHA